jgi:hypothetical protein
MPGMGMPPARSPMPGSAATERAASSRSQKAAAIAKTKEPVACLELARAEASSRAEQAVEQAIKTIEIARPAEFIAAFRHGFPEFDRRARPAGRDASPAAHDVAKRAACAADTWTTDAANGLARNRGFQRWTGLGQGDGSNHLSDDGAGWGGHPQMTDPDWNSGHRADGVPNWQGGNPDMFDPDWSSARRKGMMFRRLSLRH